MNFVANYYCERGLSAARIGGAGTLAGSNAHVSKNMSELGGAVGVRAFAAPKGLRPRRRELAPAFAAGASFDSGGKPHALHTLREIHRSWILPIQALLSG